MQKWDVEPELVAARVVEQFPYESEHIVLDFLEGAANANDQRNALFWTIVLNLVEHMQMRMTGEIGYPTEIRFSAVM